MVNFHKKKVKLYYYMKTILIHDQPGVDTILRFFGSKPTKFKYLWIPISPGVQALPVDP